MGAKHRRTIQVSGFRQVPDVVRVARPASLVGCTRGAPGLMWG